jgi:hypothetical protein
MGAHQDRARVEFETERERGRTARIEQQTVRIQLLIALVKLATVSIGACAFIGGVVLALAFRL